MYADRGALKTWTGLEISDVAVLTVAQDRQCAVCGGAPAPLGLYRNNELARWADTHHMSVGNPVIPIPRDARCPVCCSQLVAVLGVPDYLLIGFYKRLSEPQRRFLENRFVFGVCQSCRTVHREETAETIGDRYALVVQQRGGTAPAGDRVFAEILGLIAQEILVQKQGFGT